MSETVYANAQAVSRKGGSNAATSFPDVCKTPSAGGPVPVPYPNTGMQDNLRQANKVDGKAAVGNEAARQLQSEAVDSLARYSGIKVKSATAAVLMGGAVFKKSTGDEAGTTGRGGIASRATGKTYLVDPLNAKTHGGNLVDL